ncbi:MAG: hypothetical protein HY400_04245 [Elusimicrobia bacterium]|nr:hypothetical protein [Elusimicrobiota bacterium]
MASGHIVECPFCHGSVEIDRESGKVLQKWPPSSLGVAPGGDKLKAAMQKLQKDKESREKYFSTAKESEEERKRKLREQFEKEKERIRKEGDITPPERPFDLD